ncbi:collagen-like protein, partial [Lactiplantibacillus plantarum]|nr:collagen-like protein [Lactiplantibacillus plantarum]MCW6115585.1 collagen-like protein [Lactiplantibacillus plantarum]
YNLYQKYGSTFTLRYDWFVTDTASAYTGQMQQQFNNNPWTVEGFVYISSSNTSGHVTKTFSLENDSANTATGFEFRLDNVPATSTIKVSNMKLEKGNVATDWCPNPSEILTQSDYAKIKAAIVALGGSLS